MGYLVQVFNAVNIPTARKMQLNGSHSRFNIIRGFNAFLPLAKFSGCHLESHTAISGFLVKYPTLYVCISNDFELLYLRVYKPHLDF
jgi:hypothetical protein